MSGKLEIKIQDANLSKIIYLNERQKQILNFIEEIKLCKIGDIHRNFSDVSINTLKKDMKYLVENGILGKTEQRKGSIYRLVSSKT